MSDINHVAKICHEVNRVIQRYTGDPAPSPAWEDAPEWQRRSAREGVEQALSGATPEELHQSWVDFKVADGWTYGLIKDEVKRTHPCIVPYEELPESQRLKDQAFHAIVQAFVAGGND